MVATEPAKTRGGVLVLVLNAACFAVALGLQKIRMETIGVEATNVLQGIAKATLTILSILALVGFGSFALALREAGSKQALLLACVVTLAFYIAFVIVAGTLWGS